MKEEQCDGLVPTAPNISTMRRGGKTRRNLIKCQLLLKNVIIMLKQIILLRVHRYSYMQNQISKIPNYMSYAIMNRSNLCQTQKRE